ncbi:MAG: thioredoxin domain-containing protein [Myxococcales bacterium]|nr:thioredoxin domain-containing protein [Myxococcales bacterium]
MISRTTRAIALGLLLVSATGACGRRAVPVADVTLQTKPVAEVAVATGTEPRAPADDSERDAAVPVFATDPTDGNRDALVTLVEFSDLQCPFCGRAASTVDALREAYTPDQLRIVWRHYPLPFHPFARPLAEAGVGVLELGGSPAFFRYQREAFAALGRAGGLTAASPRHFAEGAGVSGDAIDDGLRDHRWAATVDRDLDVGQRLGVNGTPAFFINGVALGGAQPLEKFKEVIDTELARAKALVAEGTPRRSVYVAATKTGFTPPKREEPEAEPPPDLTVYKVPVGNSPSLGPQTALVTIVEFSDFQCPYCKRVEPTLTEVRRHYGDKVRLVWKDMPLPFHSRAVPAAILAREARAQRGDAAFWDMHGRLYADQTNLEEAGLLALARQAKLDTGRVSRALAQKSHLAAIEADMDAGDDVNASGTPHFFINGRRLVGAQPLEKFKEIIDVELARAEAQVRAGTPASGVYAELQKSAQLTTPPVVKKTVASDPQAPFRGAAGAKVTILEFSDLQCPFCRRVEPTLDEVLKAFPGKVRVEWRNLPLAMHADAELAAEAALEAKKQKGNAGFFKMQKLIFDGQGQPDGLKRDALDGYARTVGLDPTKFAAALDGHVHLAAIQRDKAAASAAGISGTPAFLVNGVYLSGAQPYRRFRRVVQAALSGKP